MALSVSSPGSPSSTLYTTIQLSGPDDMGKRRRKRTIIATEQLSKLEALYKQEQWPNRERKEKLAKEIAMSTHFVNIWFQNKRSRMKKMAQEEAELAAIRNESGKCEPEQEQEKEKNFKKSNTPKAIAPKSPIMTGKTSDQTQLKDSPQVLRVKLQMLAQSPQSQTLSPVAKRSKLVTDIDQEESTVNMVKEHLQLQQVQQVQVSFPSPGKCEPKIDKVQLQHPTSPASASQQIQLLAQQQQTQKPKIRFGTNPAVVLNKLQMPTISVNSMKEIPTQETSSGSSTNEYTNSPPASGNNLFDCLVAMVALEEGGIIQKAEPTYDIAVNSALYGIKVDDEMVLTYDKKKGLKFRNTGSEDMP